MTTTATRTSSRIRRAPRRYDEEDWTPGANNGSTVGRKTDSWVSGELRDVDLERERRLARLEDASIRNKGSPTLQGIYFGQEIAEARLAAEWAKLAKASQAVQDQFASLRAAKDEHEQLYSTRKRQLDARQAELAALKETLEEREFEMEQARLDAKFIAPESDEDCATEDEEEEEAVSSDEEEEEDEEALAELEDQYECGEESDDEVDEEKDNWCDEEPPTLPQAKRDWIGLGCVGVALVAACMHPEKSQYWPAPVAVASVVMYICPPIGRAFGTAISIAVPSLLLALVVTHITTAVTLHDVKL